MGGWFGNLMKIFIYAIIFFIMAMMVIYLYRKGRDAFNDVDKEKRLRNAKRIDKTFDASTRIVEKNASKVIDKTADLIDTAIKN